MVLAFLLLLLPPQVMPEERNSLSLPPMLRLNEVDGDVYQFRSLGTFTLQLVVWERGGGATCTGNIEEANAQVVGIYACQVMNIQ